MPCASCLWKGSSGFQALNLIFSSLETGSFTCTLVSPLCVYKISQHNGEIKMENYLKWTKVLCTKYRFARYADISSWQSGGEFDLIFMLGGLWAAFLVSEENKKRPFSEHIRVWSDRYRCNDTERDRAVATPVAPSTNCPQGQPCTWNDPWLLLPVWLKKHFFVVKGHFCSLLISNIID